MFVLSFKMLAIILQEILPQKYCMLLVEIKDINALIDNKPFLISQ